MKIEKEKRERFMRLSTYRTNRILHGIKTLSNCSNRSAYQYFDFDIDKIFELIKSRLGSCERIFKSELDKQTLKEKMK
jgi:hypothetical protein